MEPSAVESWTPLIGGAFIVLAVFLLHMFLIRFILGTSKIIKQLEKIICQQKDMTILLNDISNQGESSN